MARIVADGQSRFWESPEFQAKLRALHESIEARYASDLSSADVFRRWLIRIRVRREFRRESRLIVPSEVSLY